MNFGFLIQWAETKAINLLVIEMHWYSQVTRRKDILVLDVVNRGNINIFETKYVIFGNPNFVCI